MAKKPSAVQRKYDIFISYARRDSPRVRQLLYEPLLQCRFREESRRPRIFFDVAAEGIRSGANYLVELSNALERSDRFIAAYTEAYFARDMCQWELHQAFRLDPMGRRRFIQPLLMDGVPLSRVPFVVQAIQTIDLQWDDWFARLCSELGLVPLEQVAALRFRDAPPPQVVVNHTLPSMRVEVHGREEDHEEFEVVLSAEQGQLQGTTRGTTSNGVVSFDDLSMGSEAEEACLIAEAPGLPAARSSPFRVTAPAVPDPGPPHIQEAGEPVFFANAQALAVLSNDRVQIYSLDGGLLGAARESPILMQPRKILARWGAYIAVATWLGGVELFDIDGRHLSWQFGRTSQGFRIPGAVAFGQDCAYIGFWDGDIYRLDVTATEPIQVLRHQGGVQALAAVGDRLYACGFDGNLAAYAGGRMVNATPLESAIRALRPDRERLVAVGSKRLYQIRLPQLRVLSEPLSLKRVTSVLDGTLLPVVMDSAGSGIRCDVELTIRTEFRTTPGSHPVSADDAGRYCIVQHPDGGHSLIRQNRVVFSSRESALSVSPTGDLFALGDNDGIRLLSEEDLLQLVSESTRGA